MTVSGVVGGSSFVVAEGGSDVVGVAGVSVLCFFDGCSK